MNYVQNTSGIMMIQNMLSYVGVGRKGAELSDEHTLNFIFK